MVIMVEIVFMLALCTPSQSAPTDKADPAPIYRWLDSCHFDFLDKPFVEVLDRSEGTPKMRYGFLCKPGQPNFEVMSLGLRYVRFLKAATYHEIDLKDWLDRSDLIPTQYPDYLSRPNVADLPPDGVDYCLESWLADKYGQAPTAVRLFSKVEHGPRYIRGQVGEKEASSLDWIQAEVPARYCSNLIRDLTNDQIPREVVADEARGFLSKFPHASEAAFATEAIQLTTEKSSPVQPETSVFLSKLTGQARIAAMVDHLIDVSNYGIYSSPTMYMFNWDQHYNDLYWEGFPAVPALIAALGDRRITKVGAGGEADPSPSSLFRVRDMACRILNEITGQKFGGIDSLFGTLSDAEAAKVEEAAKAWWGEIERTGEVRWVRQAILRGDSNAGSLAEWLSTLDPPSTWPTVRDGYGKAPNSSERGRLLGVAFSVGGREADAFVKHQMMAGVDSPTRVSAAELLLPSNPSIVFTALLAEFDHPKTADFYNDSSARNILLGLGKAPILDHIRRRLPRLDARQRADIVTGLTVKPSWWVLGSRITKLTFSAPEIIARRKVVENLLADELNDTDRLTNTGIGLDSQQFQDPRVCELASYELAKQIGPPYRFYETKSIQEGDALRAANRRVWRVRH